MAFPGIYDLAQGNLLVRLYNGDINTTATSAVATATPLPLLAITTAKEVDGNSLKRKQIHAQSGTRDYLVHVCFAKPWTLTLHNISSGPFNYQKNPQALYNLRPWVHTQYPNAVSTYRVM